VHDNFDDTTEQHIPWIPPMQDVTILDPERTVAAPLDSTQFMATPRVSKGNLARRVLGGLLIFDIVLGTGALIMLGRTPPHKPVGAVGTEPESSSTFPTFTTPSTSPVTVTTRVKTTAAPLTTMAASTQAPKTTAACKP
jgi:hypothetical protein